jgi:polar amino acid transport system substrate-binding protein
VSNRLLSIFKQCKKIAICLLFSSQCIQAETITVCFEDTDYPPFINANQQVNPIYGGLLIDIVNQAAKQSNIKMNFIRRPWLRCQKMVEDNQAQALFAMIKTPQRMEQFAFPSVKNHMLMKAKYHAFFKRDGAFSDQAIQDNLTLTNGKLNIKQYKNKTLYGLSAPSGYVVKQFLRDNEILSPHDYTLDQEYK